MMYDDYGNDGWHDRPTPTELEWERKRARGICPNCNGRLDALAHDPAGCDCERGELESEDRTLP